PGAGGEGGDRRVAAGAPRRRGTVGILFDPRAARASAANAIALADEVDDVWLRGVSRQLHAMTRSQLEQHDEARPSLDEAIAIASEHAIPHLDVWNRVNLMQAAVAHGEFDEAVHHFETATRESATSG